MKGLNIEILQIFRPVAQLAERRSPTPQVGGSIPSWPAKVLKRWFSLVSTKVDLRQDRRKVWTLDHLKWSIFCVGLAAALFGYYTFSNISIYIRASVLILILLALAVLVSNTVKGRFVWHFFQDAKKEIRMVIWPSRQETIQTALMVMLVVAIMGLILWGIDLILFRIISAIMKFGGGLTHG